MRFPPRFVPVVSALLVGCTAIRTVERADLSPPNPPIRVWVTRADHTTVVLDSARVRADSLIGLVDDEPQRLPLSEAIVLRVRQPAPDRTAALVFVGVAGVAVYALHLLGKTPPSGPACHFRPVGQPVCE